MKYSKEYETILNTDSFPPQWKNSAIEYRKLKKLIKNVADELSSLGLNPEVLQKILKPEDIPSTSISTSQGQAILHSPIPRKARQASFTLDSALIEQEQSRKPSAAQLARISSPLSDDGADGDIEELEFEFDEIPDAALDASDDEHESRIGTVARPGNFRVRLPSHGSLGTEQERTRFQAETAASERISGTHPTFWTSKVKAEYVLSGPSDHPTPEIRLFLSSSPSHLSSSSTPDVEFPNTLLRRSASAEGHDVRDNHGQGQVRLDIKRPQTGCISSEDESEDLPVQPAASHRVIPSSPRLERIKESPSPIFAITTGGVNTQGMESLRDGLDDLDLGDPALVFNDQQGPKRAITSVASTDQVVSVRSDLGEKDDAVDLLATKGPEREIVVSLPSDIAFFELLCQALSSLSDLHAKQQEIFNTAVQHLCGLVSSSIVPQTGGSVIRNIHLPLTKRKEDKTSYDPAHVPGSSSYHKSDLYAWREIFTLWIEAQIFESSSERDRGERSVEQADKRLQAFASEVVKRGLGDRRTLRRRESREAWEEFLRLNVLLLDLKRFQIANINAARKILKKHDKRTALTASVGFPQFVRSSLDAHVDQNGNVNTWAFYSTSLPHVLLTSLTETLLPILPSLEDYTCLICTSIAFKPIRLSCGHLFCVRCLAKMQRAGAAECPLCRARTVLQADRSSLDRDMLEFMEKWFPLEVKRKQKDNELEIAKAEAQQLGVEKCTIM